MGSASRLKLIDLLRQAPRTVEVLAAEAGLSVANTSQHLKELKSARLVDAEKSGHWVLYRLRSDQTSALFMAVRRIAEASDPEMDRLRAGLQVLTDDDREALLARIAAGKVTLLDVRPATEHEAGHLEGALSIPLEELPARLGEIPRVREVVAYCRGPYCSLALEAVALLEEAGFRACHLDLGVPDLGDRAMIIRSTQGGTNEVVLADDRERTVRAPRKRRIRRGRG